jgi:hypothetical protein
MNKDQKLLAEKYQQILLEAKFCGKCGAPLTGPTSKFCGKCGAPVVQRPGNNTDQAINQTMSNVRQAVNTVGQKQQQQGQQAQQQIGNLMTNFQSQVQGMKDENNKQRQAADQTQQGAVQQVQQDRQQIENPYKAAYPQLQAMAQEYKDKVQNIKSQVQAGKLTPAEGRAQELQALKDYKTASDEIQGGLFKKIETGAKQYINAGTK